MRRNRPFVVWITGLPASGKSTLSQELLDRLHNIGVLPVVLESDALRTVLTPEPTYSTEERDLFYRQLVLIGNIITTQGIPVIFDATAHLKRYRDFARSFFPFFIEVFIDTPLDICRKRDPKGIYAKAADGKTSSVPGIQVRYEKPDFPDLVLDGLKPFSANAARIIEYLHEFRYI